MKRRAMQRPFIRVRIGDCPHGSDDIEVLAWRAWWAGPGQGGTQRELFRYCQARPDGADPEAIAQVLERLAAAFRG